MTDARHTSDEKNAPPGQLGPVRAGHEFDEVALAAYLTSKLPGADTLRVRQFEGGQSNPTFLLETSGARFVLRKKPAGKLLASAHAVEREYRVMDALRGTGVPVPNVRVLCEDASVIGTPFYVMDLVEGRIERDPSLPGATRDERGATYEAAIATLSRLHRVDWRAVGLGDYGKPEHYLARQIARWSKQYDASRTHEIEAMDWLIAWLPANLPAEEPATIVHGDYRVDNLVLVRDEPRIAAVLDWELSTIGDPLSEVAYHCLPYHLPSGKPGLPGLEGTDLAMLGIPSEASLVASYCKHTGRASIDPWSFYVAFGLFRLAAIVQGVYARALQGNASSERARAVGAQASLFATIAKRVAQEGGGPRA